MALTVRTIGPFFPDGGDDPVEKPARVLLSSDFLKMGLAAGTQTVLDRTIPENGEPAHLTDEEARTVGSRFVAMFEFLKMVRRTPGLNDLLAEIIRRPSLFSLIRHRGVRADFKMHGEALVPASAWPQHDQPIYRFDLETRLNGRLAMNSILVVSEPRPPLLPTAGLLGLMSTPPYHRDLRMDLELLAARASVDLH